jgi:hypothetical protein
LEDAFIRANRPITTVSTGGGGTKNLKISFPVIIIIFVAKFHRFFGGIFFFKLILTYSLSLSLSLSLKKLVKKKI